MEHHPWVKEIGSAITVCDRQGVIIEMNDVAINQFKKEGGKALLGSNLLDCHPEPARTKLKELMDQQMLNIYTIEKKGIKKLIYQTPWYQNGQYQGFVEMSVILPEIIPHFKRQS